MEWERIPGVDLVVSIWQVHSSPKKQTARGLKGQIVDGPMPPSVLHLRHGPFDAPWVSVVEIKKENEAGCRYLFLLISQESTLKHSLNPQSNQLNLPTKQPKHSAQRNHRPQQKPGPSRPFGLIRPCTCATRRS